ncbi:metal-dependent hydrolase [Metabacillus sp. GX 13764]|uniref:metal-dependent hydrolase n=1 Tax=Metabacillus kandeliae TaxID=2900151 RepID=UPI001E5A4856|nr:metal-dependent hydrolase [Metabacillus kandeliae]MCD7036381.1 metal-dependent hydrolase [Metabacillus kandeliae]
MDTGTHVVMGIALGGIATLDPAVGLQTPEAHAVMAAVLIGSQAPDIDTVLKLKNNAVYIRNHRGITHSIPAVFLWTLLIGGMVSIFSPGIDLVHLFMWTFIAVAFHVFVDIFNAYGTQAIRPFSRKWVALGIINTFDPYIFFIHIGGIVIWALGMPPGFAFTAVYVILAGYYLTRIMIKRKLVHDIKKMFDDIVDITIAPTIKFSKWHLAITTEKKFYVGKAKEGKILILDEFNRKPLPQTELIKAAEKDHNIAAFLSFSPVYRWEIDEYKDHYEVRFIDLRYRSKEYYPFVAIVQLDTDLNIISSYTGWIFSEEKLRKKLHLLPD